MADRCFPPIAGADARVLILGSLPGQMSLQRQQYYALPRNAFWAIMGQLVGAGPESPYAQRTQTLVERRIALWDVCAVAERAGSLDSAILRASVVPNDFAGFLGRHADIRLICFNGAKAAELYRRLVDPALHAALRDIPTRVLPSTSPAHASMSFDDKLTHWRAVTEALDARIR